MRIHKSRIAWLGLMIAVAGCGGKAYDAPKLMPVSGTVTLDGKPLAGAVLTFVPIGSTRGKGATGVAEKDGKYQLARGGKNGAPVGEYRVVVAWSGAPNGSEPAAGSPQMVAPPAQVLPAKFSGVRDSVLRAKVGDGDNVVNFPLSSKQ
jgi:hypothetical protein